MFILKQIVGEELPELQVLEALICYNVKGLFPIQSGDLDDDLYCPSTYINQLNLLD